MLGTGKNSLLARRYAGDAGGAASSKATRHKLGSLAARRMRVGQRQHKSRKVGMFK
jgi:hypothetical protein